MISRVSMPAVHALHPVDHDIKAKLQELLRAYLDNNRSMIPAPAGYETAAHQDITPDGFTGAQWEAYHIGKAFYARITLITFPPMVKWYKVGLWPTA